MKNRPAKPKIVCVCGSVEDRKQLFAILRQEAERGNIVLAPSLLYGKGTEARLKELERQKIDMADEILVIREYGRAPRETKADIRYARRHGKAVRYFGKQKHGPFRWELPSECRIGMGSI